MHTAKAPPACAWQRPATQVFAPPRAPGGGGGGGGAGAAAAGAAAPGERLLGGSLVFSRLSPRASCRACGTLLGTAAGAVPHLLELRHVDLSGSGVLEGRHQLHPEKLQVRRCPAADNDDCSMVLLGLGARSTSGRLQRNSRLALLACSPLAGSGAQRRDLCREWPRRRLWLGRARGPRAGAGRRGGRLAAPQGEWRRPGHRMHTLHAPPPRVAAARVLRFGRHSRAALHVRRCRRGSRWAQPSSFRRWASATASPA